MSDSTSLSKLKSDVQLSRDIEEGPMHLIPGGRYVVMLEAEQVSVVDLHAKDGEDSIVATYETERPLTVAEGCVWVAENGMKVYILQQFTSPIKQRINSQDPCKSTTTTYTLLEFGLGENCKVSVVDKATLRVAHWAESLPTHPVMGSSIALTDDEMGVTVIWNPVDNEVAALRVGCLGSEAPDNIGKAFSKGSFMFFANGKGIQAVEIPCFDSLDNDSIIMSDLRPNTVECYTAKLSRALASVQERNILIPASPGLPVLYDFLVKDTEADSLHVHRHALEFNPDLPDKITLKLVEISKCSLIRGSSELTSQHNAFCDGRVAYLWVPQEPGSWASPNQAYVSLSPPIPSHVNNVVNSKFSVTPCYEKEAEDIYEFGLCPISGIGIGLKGSAIEVYNISRGCRA
ncbi:hypothetical protein BKA70DRAFT_1267568 [Coprinopsis sp. MPI-PUGE-AT-0042]|nr:hypothetical protein BKA70DRAFT_1267568 [Coprinopsis sp. MPI-PUGE-AT-0042]